MTPVSSLLFQKGHRFILDILVLRSIVERKEATRYEILTDMPKQVSLTNVRCATDRLLKSGCVTRRKSDANGQPWVFSVNQAAPSNEIL